MSCNHQGRKGPLFCLDCQSDRIAELEAWVNDLQAGMYINCVYCGHRYGPNDEVPASMADVLKEHVEQCPSHPMSALRKANAELVRAVRTALLETNPNLYRARLRTVLAKYGVGKEASDANTR